MYTNEEILKESKSESLRKVKVWKNKIIDKLVRVLKNNKFLLATLSAFILFSIVNAMIKY